MPPNGVEKKTAVVTSRKSLKATMNVPRGPDVHPLVLTIRRKIAANAETMPQQKPTVKPHQKVLVKCTHVPMQTG